MPLSSGKFSGWAPQRAGLTWLLIAVELACTVKGSTSLGGYYSSRQALRAHLADTPGASTPAPAPAEFSWLSSQALTPKAETENSA